MLFKTFHTFHMGGLQGLAYTLREAWLVRRINRVARHMERERALHLQHMSQLRAELDALKLSQFQLVARAARLWRAQL